MVAYVMVALAWAAGAFVSGLAARRGRPWGFLAFAGLVLFLVMALRETSVGSDTAGYRQQYYLRYQREEEPGFSALTRVAFDSGLSFQQFLALTALVTVVALIAVVAVYSEHPFMTLYLHLTIGFFALSLSGIRQTLAVSITLVAFMFLMRGKRLLFIALVVLAAAFHNSAIFFLLVFFLRGVKLNRRTASLLIAASLVLVIPLGIIGTAVDFLAFDRYEYYLSEHDAALNPLTVLVAGLIPVACLFLWPSDGQESITDERDRGPNMTSVFMAMAIINFAVTILALDAPIVSRLTFYFITYVAILLPNLIGRVRDENARRGAWLVCLTLPAIQFFLSVPGGSLGIDHYQAIGW